MKKQAENKRKYLADDFDTSGRYDDYRSRLEETERLKQFRARKEKELQRRRRNRRLRRLLIAAAAVFVLLCGIAWAVNALIPQFGNVLAGAGERVTAVVSHLTGSKDKETEAETEPQTETEQTESEREELTTEEPTTEEPTTEEPTTEEPTKAVDPREDVWTHYTNMFLVANTDSYLNVRDQPTQDGMIIGKLVKYAGGNVVEDLQNGWFHITSGGIDGYVASEYCLTGEEARQVALEHCIEMVEVTAERLNVRTGPGEEYETWTQLNASEKQVVKGEENGWLKVAFNGTYGYISKEYTKKGYYLVEAMPWSSISNCSETRQRLFAYAEQFIGTPYKYGGTDLYNGIDCSSYVQQCFRNAIGISLPRTSREQVNCGIPISLAEAKPGDLLFYADATGTIDHVVMYMGDGKILQAAQSLGQVIISKYNYSTEPVAVRNVIGD